MDYKQLDDEQLFAHLETLLDRLPFIQEMDAKLSLAKEARELLELSARVQDLEEEIQGYEKIKQQAIQDIADAKESGKNEVEGQSLSLLRMYSDLHSARLAPLQRAEQGLNNLLKESSLKLSDDLKTYALDDSEYLKLENEVRSFRKEYLEVYDLCLEKEGGKV